MVQINQAQRELSLKLVYYGPALSGKTTNLVALHRRMDPARRGRMIMLDTRNDRTLFFDMLPLQFRTGSNYRVKTKLYTVPGQVIHAATRRLVLQGADGVVFVADAQRNATGTNNAAWRSLVEDLRANGLCPETTPIVIQFNKMDLPDARSLEEIEEVARKGREPVLTSVALEGEGVVETLRRVMQLAFRHLDGKYRLASVLRTAEEDFLAEVFRPFGRGETALKRRTLGEA